MRHHRLIGAGVSVGIAVAVCFVAWLCLPASHFCRVTETHWRYDIELQQRTTKHDAEWGRPIGKEDVRNLKCESRYRGTHQCMCHEVCFGSGKSRICHHSCSQCPVYRDWCEYDHTVWTTAKTFVKEGSWLPVEWPDADNPSPDQRLVRHEHYGVTFTDRSTGETYAYEPADLPTFKLLRKDGVWEVEVYLTGRAAPVLPPERR